MEDETKYGKEKVIGWGIGFLDIKSGKNITHHVTGMHVSNHNSMVTVIIEKGQKVEQIKFSMEHAQEIGFINMNALKDYCK